MFKQLQCKSAHSTNAALKLGVNLPGPLLKTTDRPYKKTELAQAKKKAAKPHAGSTNHVRIWAMFLHFLHCVRTACTLQ